MTNALPNYRNSQSLSHLMQDREIQIQIGPRTYPLRAPAPELERLRQAETLLNQRLLEYKTQHPGADSADLMGMTAFYLAHSLLHQQEAGMEDTSLSDHKAGMDEPRPLDQRLRDLEQSLNRILHHKVKG